MKDNSVSCEEVRAIIENLSPKTVEKTAQKQFKEHLAECLQCRLLYEKNLALNRVLDQWETAKPGRNLQARIMAKVAQVERERARVTQPRDFWGQLKSLLGYKFSVPAFATALLLFFLLGSIAVNIALVSRSPAPGRTAPIIAKVEPEGMQITKSVHDIIEPSPRQPVIVKDAVVYPAGSRLFADYPSAAAAAYQQPLIIIIGVPPVLPGQSVFSPQKIYTIQNSKKEELL